MARPNDYKEQNGCWNCQHVFEKEEYDAASDFFCTVDGILQPTLNLDQVKDKSKLITFSGRQKVYDKLVRKWEKWANPRQVKECGKCGQWEKRDGTRGNS